MRSESYNQELRALHREGNHERIVLRCQELLSELRDSKEDHSEAICSVLEDMARAHYELRDFQSSLQVTQEVLATDRAIQGEVSIDGIRSLRNLGACFRRLARYGEAEQTLERALELVARSPEGEQWQYSLVLIGMARVHAVQQEYKQAEQYLLKAARQRLVDHHWQHPEFAKVYHLLSQLYFKADNPVAAQRTLQKAMRIYRLGRNQEDVTYQQMRSFLMKVKQS